MKIVSLVLVSVLFQAGSTFGREPDVGDSVVVTSEQAKVQSNQGMLGVVSAGTRFTMRKKTRGWLLGQFQIQGHTVFGWVMPSSVRLIESKVAQKTARDFTWHNLLLARDKIDDNFSLEDETLRSPHDVFGKVEQVIPATSMNIQRPAFAQHTLRSRATST